MNEYIYYSPQKNEFYFADDWDHRHMQYWTLERCKLYGVTYWEYIGEL